MRSRAHALNGLKGKLTCVSCKFPHLRQPQRKEPIHRPDVALFLRQGRQLQPFTGEREPQSRQVPIQNNHDRRATISHIRSQIKFTSSSHDCTRKLSKNKSNHVKHELHCRVNGAKVKITTATPNTAYSNALKSNPATLQLFFKYYITGRTCQKSAQSSP